MEIPTKQLPKRWRVGDIVRVINQSEHSEKQYVITDCYPDFFPKTAVLEELPEEEHLKECSYRIFTKPSLRLV